MNVLLASLYENFVKHESIKEGKKMLKSQESDSSEDSSPEAKFNLKYK